MDNDLPTDAVEMVREIRNRLYEETKNMTREEMMAHTQKSANAFEKRMEKVDPSQYDFSWLQRK